MLFSMLSARFCTLLSLLVYAQAGPPSRKLLVQFVFITGMYQDSGGSTVGHQRFVSIGSVSMLTFRATSASHGVKVVAVFLAVSIHPEHRDTKLRALTARSPRTFFLHLAHRCCLGCFCEDGGSFIYMVDIRENRVIKQGLIACVLLRYVSVSATIFTDEIARGNGKPSYNMSYTCEDSWHLGVKVESPFRQKTFPSKTQGLR